MLIKRRKLLRKPGHPGSRAYGRYNNIRTSTDSECAVDDLFSLASIMKKKKEFFANHQLFGVTVSTIEGLTRRVMTFVRHKDHLVMMDVVTGSLFNIRTGKCLSSDTLLAVKLDNRTHSQCAKHLSELKLSTIGDD